MQNRRCSAAASVCPCEAYHRAAIAQLGASRVTFGEKSRLKPSSSLPSARRARPSATEAISLSRFIASTRAQCSEADRVAAASITCTAPSIASITATRPVAKRRPRVPSEARSASAVAAATSATAASGR